MNKYAEELNYAQSKCHDNTLLGLQELVELATPQTPVTGITRAEWYARVCDCPNCGRETFYYKDLFDSKTEYCCWCGKKLGGLDNETL